jgi:hypothetical protein
VIHAFTRTLADAFERRTIPPRLKTEGESEGHIQNSRRRNQAGGCRSFKNADGDIQRFLGQCALAAVKHDAVTGLCGHRSTPNEELQQHTRIVERWTKKQNFRLIFRQVR